MGLAVVHGIVKSHRGAIKVFSEQGKGTTFEVFLPQVEAIPVGKEEEITEIPRGKERVLFVDDETALVDMGQRMLGSLGYEVFARTSSIEALEVFRSDPNKFDIVITDYTMPNMTGMELAKELILMRPDIPIIMCTGFSEQMSEEKAKSLGIEEFLLKPVIMRDMAKAIRKVLDKK